MSFSIFTDTPANLPSEIITGYNITVVPFSYFKDDQEFVCRDFEGFDCDAYYAELKEGAVVKTSQINPQRYIEYLEPEISAGHDILYVSLSSGVSGSFASAKIAATHLMEKYPDRKVSIIDSLGASLGEGLVVLYAARMREAGHDIDKVTEETVRYRERMCQVFTVDDLMFLRRSGRISGVGAAIGTVLGIKPLLKGNESGKIVNFTTVRGRRKAIKSLADRYKNYAVYPEGQTVGISHAGCIEDAETLRDLLIEICPPKEILIVPHEPVTGSHVGPGMLALYFAGDEGVRSKN